jgi:hypothetical protein
LSAALLGLSKLTRRYKSSDLIIRSEGVAMPAKRLPKESAETPKKTPSKAKPKKKTSRGK